MSAVRMGRAFSPQNHLGNLTQGVALGWYGTGPLALGLLYFAPTAQLHTSLGQGPRYAAPNNPRAKGPTYTSEGQRPSTGASPQESNHPTKQRAESPFHQVAGCETGNHFRGFTKMIPDGIGRAYSPREIVSTGFLGRCPRLVLRWAFGPETQTAPTARFYTSLGQRPRYATPTTT